VQPFAHPMTRSRDWVGNRLSAEPANGVKMPCRQGEQFWRWNVMNVNKF
jgi:hypothetical protein